MTYTVVFTGFSRKRSSEQNGLQTVPSDVYGFQINCDYCYKPVEAK